ncbi:MAG TPA: L-histidine N(alpha)-methyltransferase, partial [Hymenobacter sp.]|nr:L-histidine N(alpha)-methyltransferase [Hymenobacter sp.]
MSDILVDNAFRQDVIKGLSAHQKYLLPKYFYDARGDSLFQEIMQSPEYYLSRAEEEILREKSRDILQACIATQPKFDIVELGAGD